MKGNRLLQAVALSVAASIIAALLVRNVPALRRLVHGE